MSDLTRSPTSNLDPPDGGAGVAIESVDSKHRHLRLVPMTIALAMSHVDRWHRHLRKPQGARFAIGAMSGDALVGVALVGNPTARLAMDGRTAEVIRVATDGTPNACSFLLSRAKRAAQALGFTRVVTKTLPSESGASLRAVGARYRGRTTRAEKGWDRPSRPRSAVVAVEKDRREL